MSSRILAILLVLGLSLVAVVGAAFLLSGRGDLTVDPAVLVGEGRLVRGAGEAKLTIVEFSDFQCPACRASASLLQQILVGHPREVRLVYRHFPLTSIHKNAFSAAVASEIAGSKGKFWEMHDLLFERQGEWEDSADGLEIFTSYAEELGIGRDEFREAWESGSFEGEVRSDMRVGQSLGISATPTLFVGGKRVSTRDVSFAVDEALKQ